MEIGELLQFFSFYSSVCLWKNFTQPQKLFEKREEENIDGSKEMLFCRIVFFRKQLKII